MRRFVAFVCAAILAACNAGPEPQYFASDNPETLSAWGQLGVSGTIFAPADGVIPYDLNTPLFTDYAGKLRTVWVFGGEAAIYSDDAVFDFPEGTVITKTFYYEKGAGPNQVLKSDIVLGAATQLDLAKTQLVETRILVRRADGWDGLPYVWNDEQTEAYLKRTGDVKRFTLVDGDDQKDFPYIVPNVNQCAGCHATDSASRDLQPIGPKARHLDRDYEYEDAVQNQLDYWTSAGLLEGRKAMSGAANVNWLDINETISNRARAYIDINCSHCHSETGPADTSGLHLTPDTPVGPHLGLCKTPIAAGRGTGDRQYGIVPGNADRSIFAYRMASTDPAIMMPELGRALVHEEGVALIKAWIDGLDGDCGH